MNIAEKILILAKLKEELQNKKVQRPHIIRTNEECY